LFRIGAQLQNEYSITAGQFVSLFYCAQTRRLGIFPHAPGESPSGAAKITQLSRGVAFSMRGMMRLYDIAPGRYRAAFDESEGLIVFELESAPCN
jgi:hypothetical protein